MAHRRALTSDRSTVIASLDRPFRAILLNETGPRDRPCGPNFTRHRSVKISCCCRDLAICFFLAERSNLAIEVSPESHECLRWRLNWLTLRSLDRLAMTTGVRFNHVALTE